MASRLAAALALLAIGVGAAGFTAAHIALGIASLALASLGALRNRTAQIAVAVGLIECVVRTPIIHAALAPVFFSACVVAMGQFHVAMGQFYKDAQEHSTLRLLVRASPTLVLLQIALGAAYRHKAIGVMPHMAGAFLVAGLLLIVCTMVLQRSPQLLFVRSAAGALLAIVLVQVSLGISVFVMRVLDVEKAPAFVPAAAAHVVVAALTLAASTVLALEI
jgi:hypothetical protein